MKKRFIVLVDFSEYSANLLKYAYDWSRQANAELLLIHKLDYILSGRMDNNLRKEMEDRAVSDALEKLKEFSDATLGVAHNISYQATQYNLCTSVSALMAESYNNLVFIGLKKTGLLKKMFIGSVAVEVIENVNNTIVAIPAEVTLFSPERLFIAVREEYPLNIEALNHLLEFFGEAPLFITFFTVAQPGEDIAVIEKQLNALSDLYAGKYSATFAVYQGDNIVSEIKDRIENNLKELLIVQKGSRMLTDQLFRKFLVNDLVYEGGTPLIVLP